MVDLQIVQALFHADTIASTSGVLDRAANPAIFLPAAGRTFSLRLDYHW